MIPLIYKKMCPNCGGDICSERLFKGLVCKKCLPKEANPCEALEEGDFLQICNLQKEVSEFESFFEQRSGFSPRELQLMWAKRLFLDISFALLAPTGVGKTTFGLISASFLKTHGKKSYLIFPTALLAKQAYERLAQMGEDALLYDSHASQKQKEAVKEKIQEGDFSILITTTSFLYKNYSIIPQVFDFVFVDDVDSILKSAKNIDKVLYLLGFDESDIQKTLEFIDYKRRLVRQKNIDWEEFESKRKEIESIARKRKATLIVSSATANPRSRRVLLFRELLGFEVSRPSITLRNIEDIYEESDELWKRSIERIREFGKGGLLFLPSNATKEELRKFLAFLEKEGVKAQSYEEFDEEAFREGEIDVVVGFASYRNPLARGLDLPDVVRYALFVGVPKLEFKLDLQKTSSLYFFLLALVPALKSEPFFPQVLKYIDYLKRTAFIPAQRLTPQAQEKIQHIYDWLQELLNEEFIQKINKSPDVSLVKDDTFKVITADVTGYIQASGRTSRLFVGGLTKGLSFVLVDSQKAFVSLQKKVRWFSEEIVFKRAGEVDIKEILYQIDEDRKKVRAALAGGLKEQKDFFKTALVIVESPNKARTIANFYGKPLVRESKGIKIYEIAKEDKILNITASKGHVFDLNKEEGFHGVLTKPEFVEIFEPIDTTKESIMQAIRELDIEVSEVFIATDPDTEGEKIAYDLFLNSRPFNSTIKRTEFHEVTKWAFDEALQEAREVNEDRVRAQLVRRVADRWIGFEISQFLQKKFGKRSLSAGRVQTAVLEWIVLREYEAKEKVYVVTTSFGGLEAGFVFEKEEDAKSFYENLQKIKLEFIQQNEKELFRLPYSTDAMLFDAASRLHFSPQRTMQLAQDLFEAGFITYHRTDSIRVSPAGLAIAKEYITSHFGEEFYKPSPHSSQGGAHEAIRPTRAMDAQELEEFMRLQNQNITQVHLRLYDLIFRNFIASQMKEAKVLQIDAIATVLGQVAELSFYKKIIEDGNNLIWPVDIVDIEEGEVEAQKSLSTRSKVPRYSYAQIIRMMKERGVGRPSTYAITIDKLQQRRYIFQKGGILFATKKGIAVYEEIKKHPELYYFVNENYTKELESLMDGVEEGKIEFVEILQELYKTLQESIDKKEETDKRNK
ncbi:reverse gyrase [Nitratiruptor tergarcus]|uniref:Reverse gyrase n=1 Tax=Nitratiruptor tergarcus DSM 16512 TaxID=1069081 RepID=A0A1W1WQK5_9BACT|nr:reverse gyrase [Nitratiruptor tergarcus]SMC08567.1 Reverse gyrase [Nitratiruptor tergarcus DSM 16512]